MKQINAKKRGRNSRSSRSTRTPRDGKQPDAKDGKKDKKKKEREVSTVEKALLRPLMMIRKGRINFSEQFGSVVPGFLPQAGLLSLIHISEPTRPY